MQTGAQNSPHTDEPKGHAEGEARGVTEEAQGRITRTEAQSTEALMEEVLARENLLQALKRVLSNRGAAGADGMELEELKPYLREHWPRIKAQLLAGSYEPQPVRGVEIPKAGGGKRQLGIPGVVDRLIQQALLQVLQARWDGSFSESSYGFRPGRSAHQALKAAKGYVQEGRRIVVDVDLEKFFDRVNHDILMGRVPPSKSGSFWVTGWCRGSGKRSWWWRPRRRHASARKCVGARGARAAAPCPK